VRQIGALTWKMLRDRVDEVITVSTDQICAAIKDTYDDTRAICEPAGAVSLAGLKKYVAEKGVEGQTLIAINSGANMNFDRLRHVSERAEIGEQREALLAVEIPERPGSFKQFCRLIGKRQCKRWNISLFHYRNHGADYGRILMGIQVPSQEKREFKAFLEGLEFPHWDETDNTAYRLFLK